VVGGSVHNLSTRNSVIKLRIRLVGCVIPMGEIRKFYKILVRKHEGKTPFGRPVIDGRIILKCILKK
jgi:hypothetical protein